ncbi:hypothetical protein ACIOD2_46685 [Amycolatopsis sp. NPDC088138]|uniref:hypothetical protein n=1 Tax=Amycolatopsis sp. NPDC088138 TaxID=3363938 RepID=UPI0038165FAF
MSGPYRLWDTVEHAAAAFDDSATGHPPRLCVTALNAVCKQYVWLKDSDGEHC